MRVEVAAKKRRQARAGGKDASATPRSPAAFPAPAPAPAPAPSRPAKPAVAVASDELYTFNTPKNTRVPYFVPATGNHTIQPSLLLLDGCADGCADGAAPLDDSDSDDFDESLAGTDTTMVTRSFTVSLPSTATLRRAQTRG